MLFFEISEEILILLVRVILCSIILRIGYMIIQIGESSTTNIQTIINQNLIELTVASISFFVFGRDIIFIDREETPIPSEYDDFFDVEDQEENKIASFFYVWSAMISATTIFTAATAGRIHNVGHIFLTADIAGFIHPLTMRWTWNSNSFMKDTSFLDYKVTYLDSGSFSHVHLLAGTAALFTAAFLGRDVCKKNNKKSELTSKHISIGYVFVILGTIGLTIPLKTSLKEIQSPQWANFYPESFGCLIENNIFAATGGYAIASIFQLVSRSKKHRRVVQNLQAALAGMVTASSAIYLFTPLTSLVVGAIGGLVFLVIQNITFLPTDDHCNVIATHMVCGLVGSLYPKKMSELSMTYEKETLVNFMWEVVCNFAMHAMFNVSLVTVLVALDKLGYVRRKVKEPRRRLCRRIGGNVQGDEELGGRFGVIVRRQRINRNNY